MRIFNQATTKELLETEIDYELGYLTLDKLFIAHHEAVPFKHGRSVDEIVEELKAKGVGIEKGADGNSYKIIKEYESGGRDVELIEAEPDTPAKDAYDEYEDIQVYIPYTEEELQERKIAELRYKRQPMLEAFDKWEKAVLRGREQDDESVMVWYKGLLDLKENAFTEIPERIKYYL